MQISTQRPCSKCCFYLFIYLFLIAYIYECTKQAATQTAGIIAALVKGGRFSGLNLTGHHEGSSAEGNSWCNCPTSQWSTDIEIDQMTDGGHSTQEVWTGKATATWPRPGVTP